MIANVKTIYILLIIGFLAFICSTDIPQAPDAQNTAKFNCVCHKVNL